MKALRDPLIRLLFLFLKRILPKFTDLNTYFQSSHIVISDVHERMNLISKEILMVYLDARYMNEKGNNLKTIDLTNEAKYLRDGEI